MCGIQCMASNVSSPSQSYGTSTVAGRLVAFSHAPATSIGSRLGGFPTAPDAIWPIFFSPHLRRLNLSQETVPKWTLCKQSQILNNSPAGPACLGPPAPSHPCEDHPGTVGAGNTVGIPAPCCPIDCPPVPTRREIRTPRYLRCISS